MIFGRDRHIGREWARLQEAEEKHGKKSREYTRALSRWIKCLRAEAHIATQRAYREMAEVRKAAAKVREAKAIHGERSAQFAKAMRRFDEAERRVNEAMRALEPIQRAATSIDL
ncbi:MAG: hypothetical protein OXU86_04350 [Thaumarchaeota archaeon]|nr:hypothetical protein [Nitrososphaerota archaeon]RNJ72005.1 MAG: hypothetical protein EB833_05740 [Thaumarchaeota archaeon S13]RNJ73210.1 MAG: hypothetical protein EB832_02280 [Thaumarchaeota archaeon S14]RNJ74202.1 MAG: hypothetical protein EB824_03920 [Thaumarchaeota archaeon S15]MDD9808843.1 hypothetical protein [Nitrososphaerota archaeon]